MRRRPLGLVLALAALAIPALLAPARAARHRDEPGASRAHRLIQEGRVEEAARDLSALGSGRAHDLDVALVSAELRFYEGDYQGAAQKLKEVLGAARLSAGEAAEWRGLLDVAAATAEVTRGFEEQRSAGGHFLLRYAPGRDALLVPYAAEALESAYAALGDDFAGVGEDGLARPPGPIRVEIYGEVADLARVSTLTQKEIETSGTIALCKWNRLMIVSPRALVRGYPWLDTLTHEYTHFIVSRVSRNTVPIWLHEGLAKFEERRWRGPGGGGLSPAMEHLLTSAFQKKRFISFEQMYPSMAKLPSQEDTALAFAEVYTVVEYLHQKVGWPGLRRVLADMAAGESDARAVAAAAGMPFDEFLRSWKTWLRGRKPRARAPVLVAQQLKFKKGPADRTERAGEEDDSGQIGDPRARNFARLGGMLRVRSRLAAAAVEYEKAQALLGPGHPAVAHKLARTYLELGDYDHAISTAEPVRELYPELAGPNATLGGAWLKKGDMGKAAGYLEAAIRTSPFDPAVHCGLAQAYRQLRSPRLDRETHACQLLGGG